ncbi:MULTISPECIES: single-stranded DNA-binding protein [Chloracidobacterium]|jgi:single-strand DNA-binding protein|uniref:Single-stranded DNA-binding protein n=1 Tax=Chloracidobacterium thermophilum (strain B) TaxID=981222 RepID=G2LEN2_CHLTF|nr:MULTISPECIES: single-stranded DNA-binding protein [Chloracidobacterium]AEP12015.1 single stranded DNA-binding protein (ssb) [Chloracidobacterium thermophilum B]QUV77769.1 single-stranded DNA-binding protein [Chloracidobacterium thermophilum]QUV80831.1 single-stranded DNA-binding protein [Chloracidobacterium sp. D]
MSFNKIIIYGHLGRDPEIRYTPQGIPVCTFSVATSERKKGQGDSEPTETTTWFRVTAWRNLAETASKYLKKGSPVYIEGRLSAREWTDNEGTKRTSLEVTATELHLMGSRSSGEESGEVESEAAVKMDKDTPQKPAEDDAVPF